MPRGVLKRPYDVRGSVWNRFLKFCRNRGYETWADIVNQLGISRFGLQRILRDERIGRIDTRQKFVSIGLNPEWLFGGGEEVKTTLNVEHHESLAILERNPVSSKELGQLLELNSLLKEHNISIIFASKIIELYVSYLNNLEDCNPNDIDTENPNYINYRDPNDINPQDPNDLNDRNPNRED